MSKFRARLALFAVLLSLACYGLVRLCAELAQPLAFGFHKGDQTVLDDLGEPQPGKADRYPRLRGDGGHPVLCGDQRRKLAAPADRRTPARPGLAEWEFSRAGIRLRCRVLALPPGPGVT